MKKHLFFIILLCGLAGFTASCEKEPTEDELDSSTSTTSSNYFKVKIDGTAFSANLLNSSITNNILNFVAGSSTSEKAIGLFIPYEAVPGSYPTSQGAGFRITYTAPGNQNNFYSAKDNGTVTITSNNLTQRIIKGTFEADVTHTTAGPANDTVHLTAGEFIIVY
jgi:hypothetical protein